MRPKKQSPSALALEVSRPVFPGSSSFGTPEQSLRVALYTRCARRRKTIFEHPLSDQGDQLRAYCEARGWAVVAEFEDIGSGMSDRRPGLQEMMKKARSDARPFDVILVHSFSRFFRNQIELELHAMELRSRGVRLESITHEAEDSATEETRRNLMAIFGEYSSKEIGKKVSRAKKENARQGFFNGGLTPYGYEAVAAGQRGASIKKKLQPQNAEAAIVILLFQLVLMGHGASGPMDVSQATAWLNQRGYRTRSGGEWTVRRVRRLLRDRMYIGEYWYNRHADPNERLLIRVPPIVTAGVFHAVQWLIK